MLNYLLIILTIIVMLLNYAIRARPDSSVLTSSLVNLWLCFLLWSSLASQPELECNQLMESSAATFIQILSHLFWTMMTLISLSVATSNGRESSGVHEGEAGRKHAINEIVAEDEAESEVKISDQNGVERLGSEYVVFRITKQTLYFQLILMSVCCHYSMIMTDWGEPVINNTKTSFFSENWTSFWIKISIYVLSVAVYLLSQVMACKCCCPERFGN